MSPTMSPDPPSLYCLLLSLLLLLFLDARLLFLDAQLLFLDAHLLSLDARLIGGAYMANSGKKCTGEVLDSLVQFWPEFV